MLFLVLTCAYLAGFCVVIFFMPLEWEKRVTLETFGLSIDKGKKKESFVKSIITFLRRVSWVNKPICQGSFRKRMAKDLAIAHVDMTPEEFMLVKEIVIVVFLMFILPTANADLLVGFVLIGILAGHIIPEFWLKGKIKRAKAVIVKELPDAIDLLALCVNAGLDFMLSLKWVVEKSPPTIMIQELNIVLQEINVGKTRRDAIKDLAVRYDLPDLSTFSRTLIQADKMGTSVTEALNILSEEMRLARYRRGEQLALKAPLKMLVPLLLFIFPVVGILVAGPIMIDFMENNPFSSIGGNQAKK